MTLGETLQSAIKIQNETGNTGDYTSIIASLFGRIVYIRACLHGSEFFANFKQITDIHEIQGGKDVIGFVIRFACPTFGAREIHHLQYWPRENRGPFSAVVTKHRSEGIEEVPLDWVEFA